MYTTFGGCTYAWKKKRVRETSPFQTSIKLHELLGAENSLQICQCIMGRKLFGGRLEGGRKEKNVKELIKTLAGWGGLATSNITCTDLASLINIPPRLMWLNLTIKLYLTSSSSTTTSSLSLLLLLFVPVLEAKRGWVSNASHTYQLSIIPWRGDNKGTKASTKQVIIFSYIYFSWSFLPLILVMSRRGSTSR